MTQVSPADLRGLLRDDVIGLLLGALLMLTGLVAVALLAVLRRRAVALLWLGSFSLLYGFRLLVRTGTFRLYFDLPPDLWERVDAAVTYTVPIPLLLFMRTILPSWRRFWNIGTIGLTGFALYAVVSDALRGQPHSALTANNVIAIGFFVGGVGWIFRSGLTPSPELALFRVGALSIALTAVADNLRGIGALPFPGPDLEPFGFTVLIACLGTIALRRVLVDTQRLVVIDRELNIARQIQSSILPQSMPQLTGLTLAARYRPMTAVAGDFYDVLPLDDHRLGVLIADVSGHGVPAALIASMVKVAIAAQRDHADRPAAVLTGMNQALCGRLGGQYVTAAYVFIDTRARVARYGAAGHPPMLRCARGTGTVDRVERNGIVLGFLEGAAYDDLERPLEAGDRLVLYTDGLIEAANAGDDLFGVERLESALAETAGLPTEGAADSLLDTLDSWSRLPPSDDLTLVVVDWDDEG